MSCDYHLIGSHHNCLSDHLFFGILLSLRLASNSLFVTPILRTKTYISDPAPDLNNLYYMYLVSTYHLRLYWCAAYNIIINE